MMGHLNRPSETDNVLRDGWYVTGDIAIIDSQGFIKLVDRQSRFSKIAGEMVPHCKIEEVLQALFPGTPSVVTADLGAIKRMAVAMNAGGGCYRLIETADLRLASSYYGGSSSPCLVTMPDNTFDIASKIDLNEVLNAVQQTSKEVQTRYDLKDSKSSVELNEKDNKILLASSDEYKLKAVTEILGQKLVKRGVSLKGLQYGTVTPAAQGSVRQEITLQQGISTDKAKEIVKTLKDSKLKVQASIQSDVVRVSGKDRDTLQQAIALLKSKDFGIDMQFTNYRTN